MNPPRLLAKDFKYVPASKTTPAHLRRTFARIRKQMEEERNQPDRANVAVIGRVKGGRG